MNKQKENMNFWIGRIVAISLFLLVLFSFKHVVAFNETSPNNSVTVEYVFNIENAAIITESISLLNYSVSVVSCELTPNSISTNININILYSNSISKLSLKVETKRFHTIKPQLFEIKSYPIRASLYKEDPRLIS